MNHCPNQQPMNFSQNSLLKEYPALLTNPLFFGLSEEEILQSIQKLSGITRSYEKGALIYHMGDVVQAMGILLKGQTLIESTDPWGNRTILSSLEAGDYFAETYALLPQEPLMVDVSVSEPALVLFLNLQQLASLTDSQVSAPVPELLQLKQNLLNLCTRKNLLLSQRIFHTAPKTIRGRLLSYLSWQAARQNSMYFTIPFSRQQLADYLNVDRSALSAELGKMKREGLIDFQKSDFRILKPKS